MKIAAIVGILLMATMVQASPFLVCDPQSGVTSYQLTGWIPATVAAQADGSLRVDVATAQVGTTNLTVAACKTDVVWGVLCSDAIPFDLVRPSGLGTPTNTRLSP